MKSRSVYVALLLVQVFFATLPIAVKIALRDLSSPALALLRVAGAALLFVALQSALVRERVRGARDYLLLAVYAVFGVVLNQLLYITALTLTTATAAQMMVTAGPALTLLIAIVARKETATARKWTGIALAGSGALYLVGVGAGEGAGSALGNFLALLNVAAYSVYLVVSRGLLRKYDALTVITWVFVFGAVGIFPWGIAPALREAPGVTAATWAALAYIVVLPTVGAYYLNVYALKRVESSVVSVFVYLQPVLTAVLAVPFLGERVSPRLLPAGLLIFAGVTVAVLEGRRERLRRGEAPSPAEQEVA
ncbi:MAG TPA: DMT family transporter, partial [Longimicrobium sp.]|nr:DMT family transporter [Longimicrobium sp.]